MIALSRTSVYAAVGALTILAACSTMAPRAEGPVFSTAGTTSTYEMRDTGSFGSATTKVTNRSAGEHTWRGRKYRATEIPQGVRLADPVTGEWVALVKGDTALVTWDPPLGYDWPLSVGKAWTRKFRVTNHATNQVTDVTATMKVENYEEVTVPAGTFKTFKVIYTDSTGAESINWWSPDGSGWVKIRSKRLSNHPLGAGTREMDLLSRSVPK